MNSRDRTPAGRRSPSFYESLVTNATDLIVVFDAAGAVTYVSPSSIRVLGYPPEELQPQLRTDLFHPDDVPVIAGAVLQGMTTPGSTGPTIGRLLHADRTYRSMEARFTNLLDDPDVAAVICNMRDITERLRVESRFRLMAQNSTDLISQHELDGTTTFVSPALPATLGIGTHDVLGKPLVGWPLLESSEDLAAAFEVALHGGTASATVEARAATGQRRWLDFALGPIVDEVTDEVVAVQSAARDITGEVMSRQALTASEERFRALFEFAPAGMLLLDDAGHVLEANAAACARLDRSTADLVGVTFYALLHPEDEVRLRALPRLTEPGQPVTLEVRYRARSQWRWAHAAVNVLRAGQSDRVLLAHLHDIDAVKRAQQDLWTAAHHDVLTGLPNRLVLADVLPGALLGVAPAPSSTTSVTSEAGDSASAGDISAVGAGGDAPLDHQARENSGHGGHGGHGPKFHEPLENLEHVGQSLPWPEVPRSVLLLDLVGFKRVNDVMGHAAGDHLLRVVASRLLATAAATDLVARLGGDEFVIISADPDPLGLARRVRAQVSAAVDVAGRTLHVDTAIGVSTVVADPSRRTSEKSRAGHGDRSRERRDGNGDGAHQDQRAAVAAALRRADAALYQTRRTSPGGITLATVSTARAAERRLNTEAELRASLQGGHFLVHYQPVFDLRDGRILAAEALVRWQHPLRGLLLPHEFLDVAEESGLIEQIGTVVLEQACRDAASWGGHRGRAPLSVTVNVSPRQLGRFSDTVARVLAQTGLPAQRLVVEITESATMAPGLGAREDLERLVASGVRVAVDDFGTGYAPLSRIKAVPASLIKIDRGFVAGCASDPLDRAIVAGVISMAHAAGCRAVAEGVDSVEQWRVLAEMGCDSAQGFLLSPPVTAEDLTRLLESGAAAPPTT